MFKIFREWVYYLRSDYFDYYSFWDILSNIPISPITCFRITKGVARYTSNFNPETDTYLNV